MNRWNGEKKAEACAHCLGKQEPAVAVVAVAVVLVVVAIGTC